MIGPAQVRLLNTEGSVAHAAAWNDPLRPKLWLYNLHYFDDLTAEGADSRHAEQRVLVARWVRENPPGSGNGWEPYPTSLRIVNWIKWALAGEALAAEWRDSLALQARWLERRLEYFLLGNHILVNAKALIFAGLWFNGSDAERWLAKGGSIYRRQLAEQVLADGGHFERSPMYHALILEDALDLLNIARAYGRETETGFAALRGQTTCMRTWLQTMCHPDGEIGFFNDSAFGVAPSLKALEAYAARLDLPARPPAKRSLVHLKESGYVRLAMGEAVALLDVAPIGPDYLPGHAHADTLSFELSIGTERAIVNGGTSEYALGPQRMLERATRSHSTVEIDGEDSSEVWGGFRVGRRAQVREVEVAETSEAVSVTAAHDGYRWRPGRPIHRRTWRMTRTGLDVTDTILGHGGRAVARFHIKPGVEVEADPDGRQGRLILPSGRHIAWEASAPAELAQSEWRPQFGIRIPSCQLAISIPTTELRTSFRW